MKKIFTFIVLSGAILGLSACHHHPNGRPFENGGFCPPGQAKKGNC